LARLVRAKWGARYGRLSEKSKQFSVVVVSTSYVRFN
jgi:hypothetical protein